MDLKTWLKTQPIDKSPRGRLIQVGRDLAHSESFFAAVCEGIDGDFRGEYIIQAKILIGKYKAQGGRFRQPGRFRLVPLCPGYEATILQFDPSKRVVREKSFEETWAGIYTRLLGLDVEETTTDLAEHRKAGTSIVVRLDTMTDRGPRRRA